MRRTASPGATETADRAAAADDRGPPSASATQTADPALTDPPEPAGAPRPAADRRSSAAATQTADLGATDPPEPAGAAAAVRRPSGAATFPGGSDATADTASPSASSSPIEAAERVVRRLPVVSQRRYALADEVARGGIGKVVRARDEHLERDVVVKVLLDSRDLATRARFVREALITARLQHPGIVPVYEAGRLPGGEPFYAMRLVPGEPLREAISARTTLEERLALLPSLIAVADTIAYAHGEGIVHRDLKPANVLVAPYGETVVVDWGLAKDLRALVDEPSGSSYETVHADMTQAGAVMGTPAYMAPEQARGQTVDERADVYAIGAMLYYLLAARPPYSGSSAAEVVRAVLAEPPAPLGAVRGVPRDLVAIVDKAMARDPAARYPTARELAADLRRFQTGQLVGAREYSRLTRLRRWIGHHRAAVLVAAILLTALAATGTIATWRILRERDRAEARTAELILAQAREVRQRRAAEELVDFMLGDQRTSLEKLGKLDLMEGVGQRVASYYDRLQAEGLDLEGRSRRAEALDAIASVYRARLRYDDAERFLGDSIRERRALLAAGGDLPSNLRAMTGSYLSLMEVATLRGSTATALAHATTALALVAPLRMVAPGDPQLDRFRSVALGRMGFELALRGRAAAALPLVRESVAAAEARPASDSRERDLYAAMTVLADVEIHYGESAHAVMLYRQIAEAFARQAAASPDDMLRKNDLVMALLRGGQAAAATGDQKGARESFTQARIAAEELLAREPENGAWQFQMSLVQQDLGLTEMRAGDWARAKEAFDACVAIGERVVAREPSTMRWYALLSGCQINSSIMAGQLGDRAGGWKLARAAIASAERVVALEPDNRDHRVMVAQLRGTLGAKYGEEGDHRAAVAELRTADAQLEKLASGNPDDIDTRGNFETLLARELRQSGDVAGALEVARRAIALVEPAIRVDPRRDLRITLAVARGEVARALRLQGDRAGARTVYDQVLDELAALRREGDLPGFREADAALFAKERKALGR